MPESCDGRDCRGAAYEVGTLKRLDETALVT